MAFEIRLAELGDLGPITRFVRDNWSSNHVFVESPEIAIWQHASATRHQGLNFVIAENDGLIEGLLGYIRYRDFDGAIRFETIALALWKTTSKAPIGTGVNLYRHLIENFDPDTVVAIGLVAEVVSIYRALGFSTGTMDHFAVFPREKINSSQSWPQQTQFNLISLNLLSGMSQTVSGLAYATSLVPEKSDRYLLARYRENPRFDYFAAELQSNDGRRQLLIARVIITENLNLLRIVDGAGDLASLSESYRAIEELVSETGVDYADLIVAGLNHDAMISEGFTSRNENRNLILPHHFDPFENRNIDLIYAVKSRLSDAAPLLLVGDGDQDRPNS